MTDSEEDPKILAARQALTDALRSVDAEQRARVMRDAQREASKTAIERSVQEGQDVWVTQTPQTAPAFLKLRACQIGHAGHSLTLTDLGPQDEGYPQRRAGRRPSPISAIPVADGPE